MGDTLPSEGTTEEVRTRVRSAIHEYEQTIYSRDETHVAFLSLDDHGTFKRELGTTIWNDRLQDTESDRTVPDKAVPDGEVWVLPLDIDSLHHEQRWREDIPFAYAQEMADLLIESDTRHNHPGSTVTDKYRVTVNATMTASEREIYERGDGTVHDSDVGISDIHLPDSVFDEQGEPGSVSREEYDERDYTRVNVPLRWLHSTTSEYVRHENITRDFAWREIADRIVELPGSTKTFPITVDHRVSIVDPDSMAEVQFDPEPPHPEAETIESETRDVTVQIGEVRFDVDRVWIPHTNEKLMKKPLGV